MGDTLMTPEAQRRQKEILDLARLRIDQEAAENAVKEAILAADSGQGSIAQAEARLGAMDTIAAEALVLSDAIREFMSPPEALRLPALLEEQRQKHGLIDACFSRQCLFNRILIYQIASNQTDTFGPGSKILRPEMVKAREKKQTCRGIIVNAGLKALDELRSNGSDLGHVVTFVSLSPWNIPLGNVNGVEFSLMVMTSGDIIGDETLMEQLKKGERSIKAHQLEGGAVEHRIEGGPLSGAPTQQAWLADEY